MDGFRPGKVPMNVVAQRYGYSVHYEVMNDKVGEAFSQAANEAKLRVAGQPRITEKEESPEGELAFDAVFEVYPEVKINDLSGAEVEKLSAEVSDAAIDKTLDILRKQRRTFAQRAQDAAAQDNDRVTVDFEGKIDGETFQGGKAEDFQFLVGEGQMLKEFEDAVRGMKAGDSRTFPLSFPADYHGKDVAGKQADFMVTVKKIEASHLPEVNEQLAKSLGIAEATVEALRADIKKNLEREVKFRLLARNKNAVMDALVANAELDLPNASVQSEVEPHDRRRPRRAQAARHQGRRQGADSRRSVPPASRAPRAPGPGRGRAGACQQPASQARAAQGPHRRTGRQLREAGRRGALVLQRQQPPGRGRGVSSSRTTSPISCWARPRSTTSRCRSTS
jgi:trigger factor